jgi:hypothetical protein
VADAGIPLDEWNGSKAARELDETTQEYKSAEAQTQQLVRMTKVLTWLTGVMSAVATGCSVSTRRRHPEPTRRAERAFMSVVRAVE